MFSRGMQTWAVVALAVPVWGVGSAAVASPPTFSTVDAALLTLECEGGRIYSGVDGDINAALREGESSSGNSTFGGVLTLQDVVVTDGTSSYRLVGGLRFGGGENAQSGTGRDSGVQHFQVIGSTGVVDTVRVTARLLPDGSIWFNNHGTCALVLDA